MPFLTLRDSPIPRVIPMSFTYLALAGGFFITASPGKPINIIFIIELPSLAFFFFLVFHSGASIYIPTKCFSFFTSSPTLVICGLFVDRHFDRCEVTSHCGFDLHFSDNL